MWKALRSVGQHYRHQRHIAQCQLVRHSSSGQPVLAIRREDNSVWERRAPLGPSQVRKLVRDGIKVIVQPSNRRAYPMQEYANAGAVIQEDMTEAPLIIGVKQVPSVLLEPHKTYVFFSHTIKAQEANMSILDTVLEKHIRLIDYEKMEDDQGRRVIAFGKYAGVAGMINILHGMGLRLLALGHHTPFMHIGPAHNYRNSEMARQAIRDAGYEISLGLLPKSIGPLTFVFTGSGNVSQGAQEVFQELPYEYVEPEHLPQVAKHGSLSKVYGCVINRKGHLIRKNGGPLDKAEYDEHPERYVSTFARNIAPYATCIINGIYWAPNHPRLMSIPEAKTLLRPQIAPWLPITEGCPQLPHRLLAICDISADPGGSIEFMKDCTDIDHPFCLYDAEEHMNNESFAGDGVMICSIDNMPTQLPRESTDYFGNLLLNHIPELIRSDAKQPFDDYDVSPVVKNAVIASNGALTPNYEYISELRQKQSSSHKTSAQEKGIRKVLILGAGYVSAPVVEYLTRPKDIWVTVASQIKDEVDYLSNRFPNTTPELLELHKGHEEVEHLIKEHDLVISLLPYHLHPKVAKLCIKNKTNMVTASYRTPQMMELDQAAQDAGITILNEVGLDPGIDHLLAMECFDTIKEQGGKVTSFESWCGGLPAPESSDNPLRYKFSWSPRGVLNNVLSGAKYLHNGKVVEVGTGGDLLKAKQKLSFLPGFNLEGFPNRDSTIYGDLYDIHSAKTLLRGTIRYQGFSEAMAGLVSMGLIDDRPHNLLHDGGPDITWREFMCSMMGAQKDVLLDTLKGMIFERVGRNDAHLACIAELGLLDGETLIAKKGNPLDTLSNFLSKKLSFEERERDMVILRHDVGIQYPDGIEETRNIDLVAYGDPDGYSAMAACVGYPAGIAAKMVLEGEIQSKGMIVPFQGSMYRPILKRLQQEGVIAREKIIRH